MDKQQQQPSAPRRRQRQIVETPGQRDVLLGRGNHCNHHSGNIRLRALIQERLEEYSTSTYFRAKDTIARQVIEEIEEDGGRFLKEYETRPIREDRVWVIVDHGYVLPKVKQAFRDAVRQRRVSQQQGASVPDYPLGSGALEPPSETRSSGIGRVPGVASLPQGSTAHPMLSAIPSRYQQLLPPFRLDSSIHRPLPTVSSHSHSSATLAAALERRSSLTGLPSLEAIAALSPRSLNQRAALGALNFPPGFYESQQRSVQLGALEQERDPIQNLLRRHRTYLEAMNPMSGDPQMGQLDLLGSGSEHSSLSLPGGTIDFTSLQAARALESNPPLASRHPIRDPQDQSECKQPAASLPRDTAVNGYRVEFSPQNRLATSRPRSHSLPGDATRTDSARRNQSGSSQNTSPSSN